MKLSVVVPAYNEETRIAKTLANIDSYLEKQSYDYEIVVIVNGTTDRTYEIVKELAGSTVNKAVAVNLPEGGKGNAVKRGILEHTTGDIIMFMDADNATPISEIAKFLPYFEQGYGVVIGSREVDPHLMKVKQSLKRQILGKMSHLLIQVVLLPGVQDSQLGFKAFTKEAAHEIFKRVITLGWAFDMEVLAIARKYGYKIKEVGVEWSEFGGGHVPMSAFAESLVDLFKIRIRMWMGKYK